MITYDNSEYISDLFSFANIQSFNLTYGMRNVAEHSNQNGKELFTFYSKIFNPKPHIDFELQQKCN